MFHHLTVLMGLVRTEPTLINFLIHMHLHVHKKSGPVGEVSWAFCACEDKERCVFNGLRETNSVVLSSLCPLMRHGMICCG